MWLVWTVRGCSMWCVSRLGLCDAVCVVSSRLVAATCSSSMIEVEVWRAVSPGLVQVGCGQPLICLGWSACSARLVLSMCTGKVAPPRPPQDGEKRRKKRENQRNRDRSFHFYDFPRTLWRAQEDRHVYEAFQMAPPAPLVFQFSGP